MQVCWTFSNHFTKLNIGLRYVTSHQRPSTTMSQSGEMPINARTCIQTWHGFSLVNMLNIQPLIGWCHLQGLVTRRVTRLECGETCYSSSSANLVTASHWSDVSHTVLWLTETEPLAQTNCIWHLQFTITWESLISFQTNWNAPKNEGQSIFGFLKYIILHQSYQCIWNKLFKWK